MPEDKTMSISFVALSATDSAVLSVASNLLEKNDIQACLLKEEDKTGTIIVIDIDNEEGAEFFNTFDYTGNRQVLLLSSKGVYNQRHEILQKPVRVQTLKDALIDIHTRLYREIPAKNSFVMPTEVSSSQDCDIKNTLFYHLLQIKKAQSIVQLFCPPHSPLFINGKENIIASAASKEVLEAITHDYTGNIKTTQLSEADFTVLARGQRLLSLDSIMWESALYGSQGQLVEGHDKQQAVTLRAWPNFPRLEFSTEHMRLAACMTGYTLSLAQIEQKMHLPWATIAGFYNALWATDLIIQGNTETASPQPMEKAEKSEKKAGLFSKLAQRLHLSN